MIFMEFGEEREERKAFLELKKPDRRS